MALLTASEYGIALPEASLEDALRDESAEVRQAVRAAREQISRAHDTPSWSPEVLTVGERKTPAMSQQTDSALMTPPPSSATRRRRFSPVKTLALVATLLLTVGILTAAGFGLGWWPPLLGDPAQYTTIGQEQTVNGVTVRLLKVYLDRGARSWSTTSSAHQRISATWMEAQHSPAPTRKKTQARCPEVEW